MKKKRLGSLFGFISTFLLVLIAISPNILHIPIAWRAWVFLGAVFWMIINTSGASWS
jgi:hypothetical protein